MTSITQSSDTSTSTGDPWASMASRLPTRAERAERLSRIEAKAIKPAEVRAEIRVVPPNLPPPRLTRTEIDTKKLADATLKLEMLHKQLESTFSNVRKLTLIVAHHYNVSLGDILSVRRNVNIVLARQMAMYLCRDFTVLSYPEIGRRLGGRDHTAVLHAFTKFDAILQLPDGKSHKTVKAETCAQIRADVVMFRVLIAVTVPGLKLPEGFRHLVRAA